MISIHSSRSNVIMGCTAAVISSACQSVGLILQRKSYINSNCCDISLNSTTQSYNRSLWHIGLFLFLFANIFGSSIQITSLPLIVLSPLQSIGLVFNTIFHTILLNEPFTNWSLYGTILISLGAFFTAYCGGSLIEPEYTLNQFIEFLKNKNFIILVLIDILVISLITIFIYIIIKQINSNLISNHINKLESHIQSLNFKLESYDEQYNLFQIIIRWFIIIIQFILTYYIIILNFIFIHNSNILWKVNGILFGILSGILSGFSILLAKSSIEILITTFINRNWKSLNETISYFIVIIFLILGILQLYLLNTGLKHISTSVLYPLVFFIYNIISISNSLVFFKQWNQLTYFTLAILIIGSSLVMIGVFLLSLQHIDSDYENDEESNMSYNSSTYPHSLHSPILKSKARYYDSIESRVDNPNSHYRDSINSDNEILDTDIINMSNSLESINSNQSTNSNSNSNLLSNSIGTISYNNNNNSNNNNTSGLNSDILAPFIRRTTENINNAGRKVSGFLSLKTNLGSNSNPNSNTSTINSNLNYRYQNHENSDISIETAIKRQDIINPHHNIHEYVSFDSLRDMTCPPNNNSQNNNNNNNNSRSNAESIKTVTANLSGDYEFLLQEYNNNKDNENSNVTVDSTNTISHGLNIFNPILGKMKKQTNSDIPITTSTNNINENNNFSKIPSSYKSIAQSIKNFAFDNSTTNTDSDKLPKIKKKSSIRSNLDDDYNPNNNFNYSFNNTLEEIQHQLNEYESPVDSIPSPKGRKINPNNDGIEHGLHDLFENRFDNINHNDSNETLDSPTFTSRILPRNYSSKYRNESGVHFQNFNILPHQRSQSKELRRSTINDIRIHSNNNSNNNNNNRKFSNHKRMLSFEQTELLYDLKK